MQRLGSFHLQPICDDEAMDAMHKGAQHNLIVYGQAAKRQSWLVGWQADARTYSHNGFRFVFRFFALLINF